MQVKKPLMGMIEIFKDLTVTKKASFMSSSSNNLIKSVPAIFENPPLHNGVTKTPGTGFMKLKPVSHY